MENNFNEETQIKNLIEKVVTDPEFKQLLIDNPDEAMKEFQLTEVQQLLVKSLRSEDLQKLTPENLEEYFSADSAVYTPDAKEELSADVASEEDI